jgi:hypothetical protein
MYEPDLTQIALSYEKLKMIMNDPFKYLNQTVLPYILDPLVVIYRFKKAQKATNDTYIMPI